MRKTLLISAAVVLGLSGVAFVLSETQLLGQQPSPSPANLPAPITTPSWILLGNSTPVTITVALPFASVITSGINLLQMSPLGTTTILGQFHDDGLNGDLVAGDGIYSIRLPFVVNTAGSLQLQVSAAFQGVLRRVLSPTFTLQVYATPPPLPPDPGPAGMTTLTGIDSDHDGVRDDVQRYIALTYTGSARTQAALTQVAKAQLFLINDSTNTSLSQLDALELAYGIECLSTSTGQNLQTYLLSLEDQVFNTPQRYQAYIVANGQSSSFHLKLASDSSSRCITPPNTLPN